MNVPINVQFIERDGAPAFAVIPYEEYIKIFPDQNTDENTLIPHEVVSIIVEKDCNLIKAWRIHLGFTQKEIATRAGISQAALSQMEKTDNNLRNSTLSKLAAAMNLSVDQLTD